MTQLKELDLGQIESERCAGKRIVFICGFFDILHPGHIRFIRYAAEQGDILVVGLIDAKHGSKEINSNEDRWNALASLSMIDYITIAGKNPNKTILALQPHAMVKGKEWETAENPEKKALDKIGAQLIFSSGERFYSAHSYFRDSDSKKLWLKPEMVAPYLARHKITERSLKSVLHRFPRIKAAVWGDLIVDEYQECQPVGMSREDPTIVLTPQTIKRFLGGAGIVAAHVKGLSAKVDFYTVIGEDDNARYAVSMLRKYGINTYALKDGMRPTTTKRRYRSMNKSLLRIHDFSEQALSLEFQEKIFADFAAQIETYDIVIFSDFNYGFLSSPLVKKLTSLCKKRGIPMVADSQSSSHTGDLGKFHDVLLTTPTEYEARLTTNNTQDGLTVVSEKLGKQLKAQNVFVTLGSDGVLIRSDNGTRWETDELPALNLQPLDVSGAGDAMLAASALVLAAEENIWHSALIGSIASARQVERVGNSPLKSSELSDALKYVFGSMENYP
ncbi:MAG: PfkB family carbohydrate kinase [Alphaproteobacteria bacterium]|nr:PfkB family carbohydrate kinase [Alphaproteobacteria bacterium]